jgi:hypothetical protein
MKEKAGVTSLARKKIQNKNSNWFYEGKDEKEKA